jgi:hypothetical protein
MKGKIIVAVALVALLAFSGVVAAAVEAGENMEKQKQTTPLDGNQFGLWERMRNRIRDTLGICDGNCNEMVEVTGVSITESAIDYDGDGIEELIIDELQGLVGTTVTMEGHMQSDNWFSVFIINGEAYRDVGKPVWSGGAGGHHGNGNGGE